MDRNRTISVERHAVAILVVFAIAAPLMSYAALRAVQSKTNRVIDWLPMSYAETSDLKWFREHFVGDQFVVIAPRIDVNSVARGAGRLAPARAGSRPTA